MRVSSSALTATLLLGLSAAVAQNAAPLRWTEGAPNSLSDVKNDVKIEGLKTDDIHIYVSLADVKETEYNRVWVQVSNHGQTPITFDPQSAILLNGDKAVRAEVPEKAANSIQKYGEAKSQELSSAHCNMMMTGQQKTGTSGCQPTDTQVQMGKQIAAFSSQQAQWVRDNGLKQKTLAPGEEVQGAIVFKKDKKPVNYVLRVPVGSVILEFPLSAQNKSSSYD
jgi:hypothetical protein